MSEPAEERGRHLGVAEDARPFAEGQIGRDNHRGALIELANEMEEQLPAWMAPADQGLICGVAFDRGCGHIFGQSMWV